MAPIVRPGSCLQMYVKLCPCIPWARPFYRSEASAGTGKSFLLTSVYLYCLLHGYSTRAAAPTGIAAANVEAGGQQKTKDVASALTIRTAQVKGTPVSATTLHNLSLGSIQPCFMFLSNNALVW